MEDKTKAIYHNHPTFVSSVEVFAIAKKCIFDLQQKSRIKVFKELAYKIRRHEEHILNTIETTLSNARVESINNKIKLFIRKAYGFRNIQNMLDMLLLGCSNILIPLPNRGGTGLKVAQIKALTVYYFQILPITMHEEPIKITISFAR